MNYLASDKSHSQHLHSPSSSFYRTQLGSVGILTRIIFAFSDGLQQPAPRMNAHLSFSFMRDPAPALLRGGADIQPVTQTISRWADQFLSMILSLPKRFL